MASKDAPKIVIIGAGPVGSLAALYAAHRGYNVEVYELRPDLRDPGTVPLNFTKSINLAVSERGITAMRSSAHPHLLSHVMAVTIPMRGRMIHGANLTTGALYTQPQDYDAHGKAIYAVDRSLLNSRLLDILDDLPNVQLFFNHKLTGADFATKRAWLEVRGEQEKREKQGGRAREIEISFDLMIGADGAHSAVRYHLMKFARMDYLQEYIDTLWCEFYLAPKRGPAGEALEGDERFAISPNHLHIWPGKDFMFIAIPSDDGSFTCTLFMPSREYTYLESSPSSVPSFFDAHFPGVTALIPPAQLIASFQTNPHLPLISIKCKPYHHGSAGVVIGDAAHAMVPFYGQGMNTGMEDVRILFSILDKHVALDAAAADNNPHPTAGDGDDRPDPAVPFAEACGAALAEYSATRPADAHAINDLALQNYVEMRSSVLSPSYRLRKYLEELASVYLPYLGWQTRYSRVSFSNEGYAEIVRKSERQGKILVRTFFGLLFSPLVVGAVVAGYKYQKTLKGIWALIKTGA